MFGFLFFPSNSSSRRVLNDLYRTKLSCCRMILLLARPLPPPPLSWRQVVSLSQALSPVELTEGKGGRGWARSQIIRPWESLVLYKSFNTLSYQPSGEVVLVTGKGKNLLPYSWGTKNSTNKLSHTYSDRKNVAGVSDTQREIYRRRILHRWETKNRLRSLWVFFNNSKWNGNIPNYQGHSWNGFKQKTFLRRSRDAFPLKKLRKRILLFK
jgi:hypothetical protein